MREGEQSDPGELKGGAELLGLAYDAHDAVKLCSELVRLRARETGESQMWVMELPHGPTTSATGASGAEMGVNTASTDQLWQEEFDNDDVINLFAEGSDLMEQSGAYGEISRVTVDEEREVTIDTTWRLMLDGRIMEGIEEDGAKPPTNWRELGLDDRKKVYADLQKWVELKR